MSTMSSNGTHTLNVEKKAREDRFQFHDYFQVDDLLDDDHRMARAAIRD